MTFIHNERRDWAHVLRFTPAEATRVRELAEWFAQPSVEIADAHAPGMNIRQRIQEMLLQRYEHLFFQHVDVRISLVDEDGRGRTVEVEDATVTIVPNLTAFQETVARVSEASERAQRSLERYQRTHYEIGALLPPGSYPSHAEWANPLALPRVTEPELPGPLANFRLNEDGTVEALTDDFSIESVETWQSDVHHTVDGSCCQNITAALSTSAQITGAWDEDLDADRRLGEIENTLTEAASWERNWENPQYAHRVDGPMDTRSLIEIPPEESDRRKHLVNTGPGTGRWVACTPSCTVCGRS